jgi:ATP-dependent helicase/nuclease subunit A
MSRVVPDRPDGADRQERRRALDPGESFIVQAPAGSGKTELLTQRYLRLLAVVEEPEEVVAITFTRKAAAEMRGRILAALQRARSEPAPERDHERMTWELARAAVDRDRERDWHIEDAPGRLRIQTIDSLCASLTRQMPLLSRFGASPDVTEDAEQLYLEAARNTLAGLEDGDEGYAQPVAVLLAHLDNDLARVEELLAAMLARRDQWLRHVADREHPSIQRETLEQALANLTRDALAAARARFPAALVAELLDLARFAADNLSRAGSSSAAVACAGLAAVPDSNPEAIELWGGLAALLLTKEGKWRAKLTVSEGFPPETSVRDRAEKARLKAMKERGQAFIEALRQEDALRESLAAIQILPPPGYTDAQWEVMQGLFELLRLAVAHLRLVFAEQGTVDFTEVSLGALAALGASDAPTELALRLDYQIKHLLVDEFQDTSIAQFELLSRLTAGWETGGGRTLFLVGDPMQSIYRFREAEVGLYLKARDEGLGQARPTALALSVNFRSQQGLVEWFNRCFAVVLPPLDRIGDGAVSYARAVAHHDALDGPAVQVHAFLDKDPAAEADKVTELVRQSLTEDLEGTVAVLVRSRSHLTEIVPRLAEVRRFRAIDIDPLGGRPVVRDLMALTRALVHPGDRLMWLALLRAPWCGLTLADLHALAGEDHKAAIWDLMQDEQRLRRLSEDGRLRLKRLREVLGASLRQRRRLPLRRWVEGTWLALGGPACADGPSALQEARVFLDLLEALDCGADLPELAGLEERLSKLFAPPDSEADERLQILTLHKAKGLQFDTVIVPGLGRSPPVQESRLLLALERPRENAGADLLLAPIKESGEEQDPIYGYLRGLDSRKETFEAGRLLYVAATRAKKRLHLLGHTMLDQKTGTPRTPPARSLLYQLWPVVKQHFAEAASGQAPARQPDQVPAPAVPRLTRLVSGWTPPEPPPSVVWQLDAADKPAHHVLPPVFSRAGATTRHIGTVVHRALHRIGREGLLVWDAARVRAHLPLYQTALAEMGVSREELREAVGRVREALLLTLEDERGRWLLAARSEGYSEYAVAGMLGGRLVQAVIDRTFAEDGVRWVVDYKVSVHAGGSLDAFLDRERDRYREQLALYARLMSRMDERPLRLGIYFPLLQGWREWLWAEDED